MLIDGFDAGAAGVHGRVEVHRLAVEAHFAVIGNEGTGKRLDQGRLAGAVVADHRKDLARIEIEVAMIEGGHPAIALGEPAGGENGRGHCETLRSHWSMATAAMMSTPTMSSCPWTSMP